MCNLIKHVHYLIAFLKNWGDVCFPGEFAESLHRRRVLFFERRQFRVRDEALFQHPRSHSFEAVEFLFPFQSSRTLISLMTTSATMSLRLRDFNDMHQRGDMLRAR